jgi:tetratricopeptide (TPR) repeat protein
MAQRHTNPSLKTQSAIPAKNTGAPASSSWRPNERIITAIICIFLVVLVSVVFGQTLGHEFINYDDDHYIRENPIVMHGLSLAGIQWAFTHVHASNWHPLTSISHMVDCEIFGLQPWGHHLTNVVLHAAATVFLFLALRVLTNMLWPSAFVAAVFAIHPLRVSSVAWIAERKDVLSGVFFMLTLWAYGRYARADQSSPGRYAITLVFFALGSMCKPTLVTLPFILLLLDYWPLRRFAFQASGLKTRRSKGDQTSLTRRKGVSEGESVRPGTIPELLIEKIPFLVISAGSCLATVLAQERAMIGAGLLSFTDRLTNAIVSYVIYLGQMIWPTHLAIVYPFPPGGWSIAQTILALLILGVISVLCFAWRQRFPFLLVGWLWFLGVLVPMIGLVQVGLQSRADRYTYLPQIGLYLALTWLGVELISQWRGGRVVLVAGAVLVIAGLTVDSYAQTSTWRDSETVWTQALASTPNNAIAHNGLGDALMMKGHTDEAITEFHKAIDLCPDCWEIYFNLGHALAKKSDWTDAIAAYTASMQAWIKPNPRNHNDLGICLAQVGKKDEAAVQFREALRIDPNFADAHRNLAVILLQLDQRDEAIVHFREALRLNPNDAAVKAQLQNLGVEM